MEVKYLLSKSDRLAIKSAFRDWSGRLTKRQKDILKSYDVETYFNGRGHLILTYNGMAVTCSSTPSDFRTGRNLTSNLIHMLQGQEEISF